MDAGRSSGRRSCGPQVHRFGVRRSFWGLAGNGLFPAASLSALSASAGACVIAATGGDDAFPAMSARRGVLVGGLRPAREQPPTLAEAVDAFLAQPDLAPS